VDAPALGRRFDIDEQDAGPSDLDALRDRDEPGPRDTLLDQVGPQRSCGRPRGGVFHDPHVGAEHPGLGAALAGHGEQVVGVGPELLQQGSQELGLGPGSNHRLDVAHRHDQLGQAREDHPGVEIRVRVIGSQRGRACHHLSVLGERSEPRGKLLHPGDPASPSTSILTSPAFTDWVTGDRTLPSDARTKAVPTPGCPANGSSVPGREDAHRVVMPTELGDERGLRETDLGCDRLHLGAFQLDRIRDHAELVAGERPVGEHVDEPEGDPHPMDRTAKGGPMGLLLQ
jgi:hypothetical protein